MKKKGFTLIEILAVVIILAVVAVIATPIVLNVIDDARRNANIESAYGIVKAGEYYYAESMLDDSKKYNLENINNIYDQVTLSGQKPDDGKLYVNEQGQVAMSITIGKNCYVKTFYSDVEEYDSNDENCDLGYVSVDEKDPEVNITISEEPSITGWYTETPYIHIKVSDSESGIQNYKWCQGLNCDAASSENIETNEKLERDILILDNKETRVCVIAYDKANNTTEKCSDILHVDTTKPEINGVMQDNSYPLNQEIDLINGVEVSDETSGIEGTYKILNEQDEEITEIDTSKSGIHEIRYVVRDKAGNETTRTVRIEISGTAPTITYSVEDGIFNELGWAKEDFAVTINVSDNSGHGIESFKVCTAITDTCDPTNGAIIEGTTGIREIVQESSNNRICVGVTDKSGKTSTLCSSSYKLDKTSPVAGTIEINGSNEIKDWYTEDAIIEAVDGIDELSGHLSTTVNIETIRESTEGTTVVVTTTDKAGNETTRNYIVKLDKTLPSITIDEPSKDGNNGWYKSKPTIKVTASDTISLFDKLKWCEGNNCNPTEELTTSSKEITIEDTEGTQVCAIAYDKAGNASEKVCSNTIKVDTIDPSFSGIGPIPVRLNERVDLISGVSVTDVTSGIDGTFKMYNSDNVEITSIDTSKSGDYEITYKVSDKAGNEKTITRKVTVSSDAPAITFEPTAIEKGWAKEDFSVTIKVTDNSGHGIKQIQTCTSTSDTCETVNGALIEGTTLEGYKCGESYCVPRDIVQESNNNRICVRVTDGFNQSSELCSDAYKLDKTAPTVGSIKVVGTKGNNDWYTSNVTIEPVNGSDSLSQHDITTVDKTSITESTKGTIVTVTTKDVAGNESTEEYTVKVDKTLPTCTFTTLNYLGVNKTGTIELTCTNSISGITEKTLTASDFTVNNAEITNISKSSVENGYKYAITVKGTSAGTFAITLKANTITTVAGLGNELKTSGNTTVTSLELSSTSGTIYVGGSNITSIITSSNAGSLSCESQNTTVATCEISGTTLIVTPVSKGETNIIVTGANGNATANYTVTVKEVTLTLNPTSGTLYVGGNSVTSTIGGSNYKGLSCTSSDTTKATCSISGTTLTITPVSAGTTTIIVTEENANQTVKSIYTATMIQPILSLSEQEGTLYVGNKTTSKTVTISGSNYGSLSCESSKPTVATCSITGTTLTVTSVSEGTTTITVTGENGNVKATYTATVIKPTLELSEISGTLYNGGSNKEITVDGTNFGTLSCTSSNNSYATCSINNTTKKLTIIPGTSAGEATITVVEANANVKVEYKATNKVPSISLSPTSGTTYIGGNNLTATITKNESAGELSCESQNTLVATCSISGTTLTMTPGTSSGTSRITVKEANGNKTATYTFNNMDPQYPIDVTFNPESKDWTNEEYYVTVTVTDTEGKLGSFSLCTETDGTCEPKTGSNVQTFTGVTTADRLITTNGVNKICIQAVDIHGRESGIYCSGEYKLDKTVPTVTISKASGSTKLTATVSPTSTISTYSYQWYKGSSAISGATSSTYTPTEAGTYSIKVTTGANKSGTSNEITIQSYTVSYNMNGGTGSIANQTKVQDISLTLSSTVPERSGYTFQGWGSSATDTTKDYDSGATYTANSGTTLYAIWKKTVTATFVSNGASLSKTSATCDMYNADTSCSVTSPKITAPANTPSVVGFNTASDATAAKNLTTSTWDSETSKNISSNVTYYAVTKKDAVTRSITYSKGTGVSAIGATSDSCTIAATYNGTAQSGSCSIKLPTITASTGYTVSGWYNSSNTKLGNAEATISVSSSQTITAKTTINSYTVTYDYATNGGTSSTVTSSSVNYDASISLSPTATKSGYEFIGWNTDSTATTGLSSLKMGTSNVTLYAIYKKTLTATFVANGSTLVDTTNTDSATSDSCVIYNKQTSCTVHSPNITASSATPDVIGFDSTSPYTSNEWSQDTSKTISSDVTYYAVTKKDAVTHSITYTKGTGVSAIGTTSGSCNIAATYNGTAQGTTCSITLPTITVLTGYGNAGWYNSSNTKLGNAEATVSVSASQTITAKASANSYTCEAGYYLGASATSCTKCEANSYCPGGTYTFTSSVQGKSSCPSGYPSSVAGSDASIDCYKTVTATFVSNGATLVDTTNTDSNTSDSCTIYNDGTTSCTVYSPNITAPSATPSVVGFNTATDATIAKNLTTSTWNVNTSKSISSNVTYYAVTRKDAVTYSITYSKGTGVSAIGTTSGSCSIAATYNGTAQGTTCSITLPTITVSTGYGNAGWYNSSNTKLGNASASISVSDSQTITASSSANSYTCEAGYYLGASATSCTKCEANSYCPGGTYTFTSSVQGKTSCPSGYPSSVAGSDASSDCYKTVTATFVANGATLVDTSNTDSNTSDSCTIYNGSSTTSCTVHSPNITRTGYAIVGFATSSTSETSAWNVNTSKSINSNVTYYAITKKIEISLSPTSGTTYVGGSNLTSTITAKNAGTLSCSSSNESVAKCSISGTTLTMTPQTGSGSAIITVKGNVDYTVTAKYTFNNMIEDYQVGVKYEVTDGTINSNGWAKADLTVKVTLTDTPGTGIKSFNLCTATTNTCDPTTGSSITGTTAERDIVMESANNRICIQATDNYGRKSSVICSDAYKLDKTKPTAGTIKVNNATPSTGWYNSALTITAVDGSDNTNGSGHGSTTVNKTSITSNTSATTVTVTTTDLAGNSATRSYTLKLDTTTPSVSIAKTSGSTKLTATVSNASSIISGTTYQWYKGTSAISGATSSTYTPTTAGTYSVKVTTGAGKTGTSNEITINSYTITYNANGGTCTTTSATKVEDIAITLSSDCSRTGYTFKGWATSSTATTAAYAGGASYTSNGNATLYAVWQVNPYTCSAGYYLGASKTSCTKCESGSYCPGGTYNFSSSTQGKNACPSGYGTSPEGSDAQNDCYLTTTAGKYIATANSSTQSSCTANYYCAATTVKYGSTGGRTACPSGYPSSAAGSDAASDCYKTYTATFVANGATLVDTTNTDSATSDSCTIYNGSTATSCTVHSPNITAPSATPTVVGFDSTSSYTSNEWSVNTSKSISSNVTYYAVTRKDAVTYSITYSKGTGVSAIGATSGSCNIAATYNGTAQGTTCSITLPTITVSTGYGNAGWYNSSNTKLGNASASISVSASQTITAKATANSYTCEAGYYLGANATSCTKCESGSYCPGGTYTYSSSVKGKNSCPSGYGSSAAGSDAQNDCYLTTTAGKYIATANTTTQSTCTANYYCPATQVKYGSTGGRTACPSGYGTSPEGSDASNDCYLTTTAGKYIATANTTTQTACTANYYCPATTIKYGSTGGRTACPSSHPSSTASSDAQADCYKTITVSYNGNGATSGSTANSSCNAYYNNGSCLITLRTNGFTKTNYTFQGWGTGTSSVTHNAGTSYSFSSNTTLNAIWQAAFICKRATTLHTETCSNGCRNLGYSSGATIKYGSLGTSGVLTSGDAFDCDVNGDGVYDAATERFYYVSDLYDTSKNSFDSNYATLIYYNNTTTGVADNTTAGNIKYYKSTSNCCYGPLTAKTNLPTTSQWSNVSLVNSTRSLRNELGGTTSYSNTAYSSDYKCTLPTAFSYSGYAARLLTAQELSKACSISLGNNIQGELNNCIYLLENTKFSTYSYTGSDGTSKYMIDGYYLESGNTLWQYPWQIEGQYSKIYQSNGSFGVRPVIEVKKTDISY